MRDVYVFTICTLLNVGHAAAGSVSASRENTHWSGRISFISTFFLGHSARTGFCADAPVHTARKKVLTALTSLACINARYQVISLKYHISRCLSLGSPLIAVVPALLLRGRPACRGEHAGHAGQSSNIDMLLGTLFGVCAAHTFNGPCYTAIYAA